MTYKEAYLLAQTESGELHLKHSSYSGMRTTVAPKTSAATGMKMVSSLLNNLECLLSKQKAKNMISVY